MKAIVIAKYGSADGLQLKEIEKPTPEENEVLIKIHATTVTFGDVMLRSFIGLRKLMFCLFFDLKSNKILGHELSGEIETVGSDVARFGKGDQVFASAGTKAGAYAEYICLPEDGMLAAKPTNMTFEEAAAVPVGGKHSAAYPSKRKYPKRTNSAYLWRFWQRRYLRRTVRQTLWRRGHRSLQHRNF